MQPVVYQPAPEIPLLQGPILLVLPVLFLVAWIAAGDMVSRLTLLGVYREFYPAGQTDHPES